MFRFLLKKNRFFLSVFKKNPYEVLGIEKTANDDDIKRAYLNLAKRYHPDVNPTFVQKFKEVNQAYSTIKDESKRAQFQSTSQRQEQHFYQDEEPFRHSNRRSPFSDSYDFYEQRMNNNFKRRANQQFHGFDPFEMDSKAKQQYRRYMHMQNQNNTGNLDSVTVFRLMFHLFINLTLIFMVGTMFYTMHMNDKIKAQRARVIYEHIPADYYDDDDYSV